MISGTELSDKVSTQLQELYELYTLNYVLDQMSTNLLLISQGSTGQIINVTNANLFALAAQYYGDATRWTTIAQANNLDDPFIGPTLFFQLVPQLVNSNLILTGTIVTPQVLTITYNGTDYDYLVLVTDTLESIINYYASVISGTRANGNILIVPLNATITTSVNRTLTIVIPQASTDSGGILGS